MTDAPADSTSDSPKPTEPSPNFQIPGEVEAEITFTWSDRPVEAQLTRTYARALVRQGVSSEEVRDRIRGAGRIVD